MKKGFKSSSFFNIFNLISYLISNIIVLFEVHKRFKGHFLNELRISFNEKKLNLFLHGHIMSIDMNHLVHHSFSKKMQGATHERKTKSKKKVTWR